MDAIPKTKTNRKSVSSSTDTATTGCFFFQKINSSKRTRETTLTCSKCRHQFRVPIGTTAFRCHECNSISGFEQSKEGVGTKLFKRDQLNNTNTNRDLPNRLSPSTSSSLSLSTAGNKRAVLCGVTYGKRKFKLEGTTNDVHNMKKLLIDQFKYPNDCIRVLTEKQHPDLTPTKRNILESLKWLVRDCQSGDSLVFYFSGHGLQQPEYDKGDETDGLDETICPVDFMREGMITDNEINSIVVSPLKNGVTLHAILDTCHSGTTLDLTYVYKKEKGSWKWEDNKPSKEPTIKQTNGGLAICLSACEDSQMAADTAAFQGKEMNGVMTYIFSKIVQKHSEITYGSLLEKIHEEIGKIHQSKFSNAILKRVFHRKIDQDPLLSSSEKFDASTRLFKL